MSANSKAIKNRIKSVNSTMHMAKAMELVASSKMRRATENMQRSKNYSDAMQQAFDGLDFSECRSSVFVREREEKKICIVVIAGDRGLAGGYNNNIYKTAALLCEGREVSIIPIGKRALDYYTRHGYEIAGEGYACVEKFTSGECAKLSRDIVKRYADGDFDALYIVYTRYESVLSQSALNKKLLPLAYKKKQAAGRAQTVFEPDSMSVLNAVMPDYLSGIIYGAVCESYACELCARRNAMSNAEQNASEMIDKLSLQYNRARQGAITQEITEIVAGSQQ